jgi:hypothetical protein
VQTFAINATFASANNADHISAQNPHVKEEMSILSTEMIIVVQWFGLPQKNYRMPFQGLPRRRQKFVV